MDSRIWALRYGDIITFGVSKSICVIRYKPKKTSYVL
jgi:hypothetical protein